MNIEDIIECFAKAIITACGIMTVAVVIGLILNAIL